MKKFFTNIKERLTGKSGWRTLLLSAVLATAVMLNVLLYALTSTFGLYFGGSGKGDLELVSLTGDTDSLFAEAIERKKEITITFCRSEEQLEQDDAGKFVIKTARLLRDKYPELLKLRFVNIITQLDHESGERVDILKYSVDLDGKETALNSGSVIFSSGDNYKVITDTSTSLGFSTFFGIGSSGGVYSYNGEEVMVSMMAWVLKDERPPVIYFTKGHGETIDVSFANLLTCLGYQVDTVDLSRSKQEDIDRAAAIIISNPRSDFESSEEGSKIDSELDRLEKYVNGGGRLFVSLDPYSRELTELEATLRGFGFDLLGGKNENGIFARDIIKDTANATSLDGMTFVTELGSGSAASTLLGVMSKYTPGSVLLSQSSVISLSGRAEPLLVSSSASSSLRGDVTTDDGGAYTAAAIATDLGEGGTVFVTSGVFLASGDLLSSQSYANREFVIALFDEYFDAPTAPYGCNTVLTDRSSLQNLTMRAARTYTAILMAIPVALAVVGAVIIIKRKNR